LERFSPDLVFLQEMSTQQLALVADEVGHHQYDMFSFDDDPAFVELQRAANSVVWNQSVVLVRRKTLHIESRKHVTLKGFYEKQTSPDDASLLVDGTYQGRLMLPVLTLRTVAEPHATFDAFSVHISGVDHQHPTEGLAALKRFVEQRSAVRCCVFGGDFNSPWCDVAEALGADTITAPLRPTHVNPHYYAVVYDHIGVRDCELTPASVSVKICDPQLTAHHHTDALVDSIYTAIAAEAEAEARSLEAAAASQPEQK